MLTEKLIEPTLDQVLEFCARDPIERVFLEDVARRGFGRFVAVEDDGRAARRRSATSARTSSRRARAAARSPRPRLGHRVEDDHRRGARGRRALARGAARACPSRAPTGPGSPSTRSPSRRRRATPACAPATLDDLELLIPVCAAAHEVELGVDPLARDAGGLPLADARADRRRPLVALARGRRRSCFKAEASAWTPTAVQIQQVWVDPSVRGQRLRGARHARPLPAAARDRRRS